MGFLDKIKKKLEQEVTKIEGAGGTADRPGQELTERARQLYRSMRLSADQMCQQYCLSGDRQLLDNVFSPELAERVMRYLDNLRARGLAWSYPPAGREDLSVDLIRSVGEGVVEFREVSHDHSQIVEAANTANVLAQASGEQRTYRVLLKVSPDGELLIHRIEAVLN